ncbi:MAG: nucleoside recognition domain-containing protein [Tissierellia bacterium]|nr:nucleoside recognition domain-containing protein [Tissierellia bacterium]
MTEKRETVHLQTNSKSVLKFIILSLIGVFLFLIPIASGDTFTIPIGIIIDWVKSHIHEFTLWPLTFLVTLNACLTVITKIAKPEFIMKNHWLRDLFDTTPLYIISRIVGAVFIIMFTFQTGPTMIIEANTGGTMIDLAQSLISILIVISFTMPLLTEFGIMEFVGILISDYVRPLFKVPGRSAIDLITSWLGASNAAVLLTKQQFDKGFYSGREAATIMTNFSLVSIPFCYIIAQMVGVESKFTAYYLIITGTGVIIALIMPRIYPIKNVPEIYSERAGKQVDEAVPQGVGKFQYAIHQASLRAEKSTFEGAMRQGADMFLSVIFGLSPIIIAWGTISLIVVEYTSVFQTIAYPMGLYMKVLGIPEAIDAAPATLVGFADMFIPGLMLTSIKSMDTRFIVSAASLLQLIYMTEVGAIIVQSDVPLKFKDLVIIFLERTLLALPIITLLTRLFVHF